MLAEKWQVADETMPVATVKGVVSLSSDGRGVGPGKEGPALFRDFEWSQDPINSIPVNECRWCHSRGKLGDRLARCKTRTSELGS